MSCELKKIFLNNYHESNKAKFVPFSGYYMPINYQLGIIKEHKQVRNAAGIFDVSHMGQVLIPLSEFNLKSLKKYIPLNIENLKIGKSYYSFLLNINGGIIDDLIISRIKYQNHEFFFIVYNASRKNEDEEIFNNNLKDFKLLSNNTLIAIQGPKSLNVLNFLDIDKNMLFMESQVLKYSNHDIIINRSGYTGEDGFEISIPNEISLDFIMILMKNHNSELCGLGSRDSLRLEAGLSLYGNELNENITPIEANLAWAIHKDRLNDDLLNGQKKILTQKLEGSDKVRIGLQPFSKSILRSNMKLINEKKIEIGFITSGGYSPTLNSSIAIAYVASLEKDSKIYTSIRGKIEELKIVRLPFVPHNYRRK